METRHKRITHFDKVTYHLSFIEKAGSYTFSVKTRDQKAQLLDQIEGLSEHQAKRIEEADGEELPNVFSEMQSASAAPDLDAAPTPREPIVSAAPASEPIAIPGSLSVTVAEDVRAPAQEVKLRRVQVGDTDYYLIPQTDTVTCNLTAFRYGSCIGAVENLPKAEALRIYQAPNEEWPRIFEQGMQKQRAEYSEGPRPSHQLERNKSHGRRVSAAVAKRDVTPRPADVGILVRGQGARRSPELPAAANLGLGTLQIDRALAHHSGVAMMSPSQTQTPGPGLRVQTAPSKAKRCGWCCGRKKKSQSIAPAPVTDTSIGAGSQLSSPVLLGSRNSFHSPPLLPAAAQASEALLMSPLLSPSAVVSSDVQNQPPTLAL